MCRPTSKMCHKSVQDGRNNLDVNTQPQSAGTLNWLQWQWAV